MFKEHIFPYQNTHEKFTFSTPISSDSEDDSLSYTDTKCSPHMSSSSDNNTTVTTDSTPIFHSDSSGSPLTTNSSVESDSITLRRSVRSSHLPKYLEDYSHDMHKYKHPTHTLNANHVNNPLNIWEDEKFL